MTRRTVLAAVLLTVLASSCNNKAIYCEPTTTVTRTKNKALNWKDPVPTTVYGEALALTC